MPRRVPHDFSVDAIELYAAQLENIVARLKAHVAKLREYQLKTLTASHASEIDRALRGLNGFTSSVELATLKAIQKASPADEWKSEKRREKK